MKKLVSSLLIAILALTFALSVSADVIFEPEDNFYTNHSDECKLMERSFVATETVYSVNEPNSSVIYGKVNSGDEIYISHTYEDNNGIVWGLISFSDVSGWIPMGYLEVIYDNTSFAEDYGNEFNAETDNLKISAQDISKLVFWNYPGSEDCWEMELWNDSYRDISFSHSYTDPDGTVWGYVGYFYGAKGWLRVDAPETTDPGFVLKKENEALFPGSVLNETNSVENGGLPPIMIAIILVSAVCVVTAALIFVLTRKKHTSKKSAL